MTLVRQGGIRQAFSSRKSPICSHFFRSWEFAFIYYNNALFDGTRNEYRLTRMTKYIRQAGLIAGDELTLSRDGDRYLVSHRRERKVERAGSVLKLGTGWRIVPI